MKQIVILLMVFSFRFGWSFPAIAGSGIDVGNVIVFTAHQSWNSRIYILSMDGGVIRHFDYEYYIFNDLEVVDNEVYVTDWVAPCLYRVDIETGELEQIVNDMSLESLYDVAWDGSYFYMKEWNLRRYTMDGTFSGSIDFPESVRGAAWDGTNYWTLNSNGEIKCWSLNAWPTVTEIPENAFAAPSANCKGLWFDGSCFWTAESIENMVGHIYQFDTSGHVVNQWTAPAFIGYAACVVQAELPSPSPSPSETCTPVPTETPPPTRPAETGTPTPGISPTPTPFQCRNTGVTLFMPAHHFNPGDICYLQAEICNASERPFVNVPFFCILEIGNSFWFYPSWTQTPDWNVLFELPPGSLVATLIEPFPWPDMDTATDLIFWAAMTDGSMTEILGEIGVWQIE